jgi:hypothetical protein
MRGGEANLRKERNKDLTSKRAPIDLNHPSKTHKLGIDHRSPIAAYSPPNPPAHLQTATHKISTEPSRSTSAAGPSSRTTSSSAASQNQAGYSTSTGLCTNTPPNHEHNQSQILEPMAVGITKEKKQMPHPGAMGDQVFGDMDITKFIEAYNCISSCTGNDPGAEAVIATLLYNCLEMIQETIMMSNRYSRKHWVQ